jgi:hypothetical protein
MGKLILTEVHKSSNATFVSECVYVMRICMFYACMRMNTCNEYLYICMHLYFVKDTSHNMVIITYTYVCLYRDNCVWLVKLRAM